MATIGGKRFRVDPSGLSAPRRQLAEAMAELIDTALGEHPGFPAATPVQVEQMSALIAEDCRGFSILANGPCPSHEEFQRLAAVAARRVFEHVVGKVGAA